MGIRVGVVLHVPTFSSARWLVTRLAVLIVCVLTHAQPSHAFTPGSPLTRMNGKDVPATNRNDLHLTVDTFAALPIAGELTLGPPTTLELLDSEPRNRVPAISASGAGRTLPASLRCPLNKDKFT